VWAPRFQFQRVSLAARAGHGHGHTTQAQARPRREARPRRGLSANLARKAQGSKNTGTVTGPGAG